ncbi:MAG: AMP-binding protein, partial [Acidobacteriota bacterium]|nr:AMP-binding protein [Acidobacteriota bacterium]
MGEKLEDGRRRQGAAEEPEVNGEAGWLGFQAAPTLDGLLRWRAARQPDRTAYIFLRDGETESARLTYAELDRWAAAIASRLLERGAAGERVLLLFPPGL